MTVEQQALVCKLYLITISAGLKTPPSKVLKHDTLRVATVFSLQTLAVAAIGRRAPFTNKRIG